MDGEDLVFRRASDGEELYIKPHTDHQTKCDFDEDGNRVDKSTGSYTQYPIKLSKAMTVWKAQGQTVNGLLHLELRNIDMSRSPGLGYVAIGRVTDLDNLTLDRPIEKEELIPPPEALRFMGETIKETQKELAL